MSRSKVSGGHRVRPLSVRSPPGAARVSREMLPRAVGIRFAIAVNFKRLVYGKFREIILRRLLFSFAKNDAGLRMIRNTKINCHCAR
ncbi:hypothetical protein GWI33_005806 [Rhynchophorus ferrugineus]|uniref:Uncharacterized protein n=1 Tax=Rhynchophorus ferrugineus TaxID=354439 RepID=A0A834MJB4_RHYFE|nr:hypothetical protein GWI33_005806 [Rhynchophorus ferrugineus]